MENQETQGLSSPSIADYPKTTFDATTLEIAKLGYESAIQLWEVESQNRMSTYSTMLIANSLILAAIGFSYQTTGFYQAIRLFLAASGILLCIVWYISEKRMAEKAIFFIYAAKEIEGKYFSDVFATLNRGDLFSKGEPITFQFKEKTKNRKMQSSGQKLKVQSAFKFVILLFFVIYLAVIVYEIF